MSDGKDQMSIFDFLTEEDNAGLIGSTGRKKGDPEDYEGFVEKFKPKLTTDDCYTPELVYNAVADYAGYNITPRRKVCMKLYTHPCYNTTVKSCGDPAARFIPRGAYDR